MSRLTTMRQTRFLCSRRASCYNLTSSLTLICVLLTLLPSSALAENSTASDTDDDNGKVAFTITDLKPLFWNQTRELELKAVEETALTLDMDQQKQVKVDFILYCSHPSVRYSIRLGTDNANVATVDGSLLYDISCKDALLRQKTPAGTSNIDNPNSDGEAPPLSAANEDSQRNTSQGGKEHTGDRVNPELDAIPVVQGSFNFTLFADLLGRTWLHMLAERQSDLASPLPDFLILPWNTPKSLSSLRKASSKSTEDHHSKLDFNSPASDFGGSSDSHVPYDVMASEDIDDVTVHELQKHVVTVMRVMRPVDYAFRIILYGFVILNTVGMGCKTEVSVVKEVLRKPIAPAIGFLCQYLLMPLIAFMLAKTMTVGDPAVSLGIFACGICPGGGASNMFCYLVDGDVSLSVTMTAISSIGALAMIPLWMFTLGEQFEDDKIDLNVPFDKIIMTLAIIIIPLFIGAGIKKFLPKVAKWILKILKPFTLVAVLFIVSFGIYANLYVFRLFAPRTLAAGCMLPYIGYTVGGLVSLIFRQPCYRIKTIAIETGIQNTSIAYLLLVFSLPAPDGDMAAVGPMASAIMTPLPLFVLVIVYLLYKRFCKKKKEGGEEGEGVEGDEEKGGDIGDGEEVALKGGVIKGEQNGDLDTESKTKEKAIENGSEGVKDNGKDDQEKIRFLDDDDENNIA
ncbi:sodium/bile acid cotransporter 5-like [Littorina saxatilis]|uniref:sodium/bile acid cotransporter 5-like n=1 Tax=Littorina saxatilis TaxID=31220 RepID=UPI0038B5D1FF